MLKFSCISIFTLSLRNINEFACHKFIPESSPKGVQHTACVYNWLHIVNFCTTTILFSGDINSTKCNLSAYGGVKNSVPFT